jgi:hypothetical protein
VSKSIRQGPVPVSGQRDACCECVGTRSVPGVLPHSATSFARWYRYGEGRAVNRVHRCPSLPITSFAQLATSLQPVATLSPGELERSVANAGSFTNGIGLDRRGLTHNLSTYFFVKWGNRGPRTIVGTPRVKLHCCALPGVEKSSRRPSELLDLGASTSQGSPELTARTC